MRPVRADGAARLGPLVVRPAADGDVAVDEVAVLHQYGPSATLNGREGVTEVDAEPGDRVRVRVVNTDNGLAAVRGASFEVLAGVICGSEFV